MYSQRASVFQYIFETISGGKEEKSWREEGSDVRNS